MKYVKSHPTGWFLKGRVKPPRGRTGERSTEIFFILLPSFIGLLSPLLIIPRKVFSVPGEGQRNSIHSSV